ncbi:unnamed protein product [Lupinus luteus]|uniref:Uncharacterized protein n=1 Tax=Lupinus luteus TaxID=3873 RepID=A0AAV1VY44_LUPLU
MEIETFHLIGCLKNKFIELRNCLKVITRELVIRQPSNSFNNFISEKGTSIVVLTGESLIKCFRKFVESPHTEAHACEEDTMYIDETIIVFIVSLCGGSGGEIIVEKEDAEQFMCSMLEKDSDLHLAVRDFGIIRKASYHLRTYPRICSNIFLKLS